MLMFSSSLLPLSLFYSCKAQRNLNSFFAIIMGLNSPAVSRLTQTWEVGRQQLQCMEIDYYIFGVVVLQSDFQSISLCL